MNHQQWRGVMTCTVMALALLLAPTAVLAQCHEMFEPGAVLPWNSFEQGRPLNHGTFEVVEVRGNKLALGQRAANNGTNVTRFDATIDGARFEASNTNPAYPETWRGNCINGMIAGEVDIYTFVINRAAGAQGTTATSAATAQSGLRIEGLLVPDQIKLNERFADGTYAWTFHRITGTRAYEGQARFSKDGSQYRGRIEFDTVSEDQLIVRRDQHGYYVFPLSNDGRRLRRGGISWASTGHAEIEGMMEAGDDLASDMLLIGPFSFPRSLSMVEAGPGGDYQWQLQRQFNSSLYVGSARNARTGEAVQGAVILEGIRDGKLVARRSPSGEYRAEILSDGSGLLPGTISWAPQYRWILPGYTRQAGSASPAVASVPVTAAAASTGGYRGPTAVTYSETLHCIGVVQVLESVEKVKPDANQALLERFAVALERSRVLVMERAPAGSSGDSVFNDIMDKMKILDAQYKRDAGPLLKAVGDDREMCLASFGAPAASPAVAAPQPQVSLPRTAQPTVTIQQYEANVQCVATLMSLMALDDGKSAGPPRLLDYSVGLEKATGTLQQHGQAVGKDKEQMGADVTRVLDEHARLMDASVPSAVFKFTSEGQKCLRDMGIQPR